MASIHKKGEALYVVYRYKNEQGETKQKWEPGYKTYNEAFIRKIEVENLLSVGILPDQFMRTVAEFIDTWLPIIYVRTIPIDCRFCERGWQCEINYGNTAQMDHRYIKARLTNQAPRISRSSLPNETPT